MRLTITSVWSPVRPRERRSRKNPIRWPTFRYRNSRALKECSPASGEFQWIGYFRSDGWSMHIAQADIQVIARRNAHGVTRCQSCAISPNGFTLGSQAVGVALTVRTARCHHRKKVSRAASKRRLFVEPCLEITGIYVHGLWHRHERPSEIQTLVRMFQIRFQQLVIHQDI